jgi:tetratricopeptide (TPR) repeat protein
MIGKLMPTSKKPRKKTSSKKTAADNVVAFTPDPRGMEGTMASIFGSCTKDPLDQAQEIMYDAWDNADPKQRIVLAHKALKISPLCADAYNLLAEEHAKTQEEALGYYLKAVEAGKEALGSDGFKEYAGHFWGFLETRPYMRARLGLGEALWVTGQKDAAIKNFQEMLVLNPGDNQGIRYVLAAKLLNAGRVNELKPLLSSCADESSADIQYTRALVAYFEDAEDAEAIAQIAWETNQYVPGMLSGRIPTIELQGYITMGGKDEASGYVEIFGQPWKQTPGAVDWIENLTSQLEREGRH